MQRTKPPFRADHVGSLLRPPELLKARDDFAAGAIDAAALRAIEDDAIRDAVRRQEEVGLRAVTDGEFRRASWHMDFIYQIDGISKEAGHLAVHVPQRAGRHRVHAGRAAHRREARHLEDDLRRRLRASSRRRRRSSVPEADDPVAEHGPLPRRQGCDRPERLRRPGRVLGRPDRRLRGRGAPARRARLHVPAVRRHEPRVHERPAPARLRRVDRRRPRAPARRVHPPHQRVARAPARRT